MQSRYRDRQIALRQFLVIQALRQGELQLSRHLQVADDPGQHVALQGIRVGHLAQVAFGLLRVIGHDQKLLRGGKAAFVVVDGEGSEEPPRVAPGQKVFHRQGPEGEGQGAQMPGQHLGLPARQGRLALHHAGDTGQVAHDPLELAEIPARGIGVGEADVIVCGRLHGVGHGITLWHGHRRSEAGGTPGRPAGRAAGRRQAP